MGQSGSFRTVYLNGGIFYIICPAFRDLTEPSFIFTKRDVASQRRQLVPLRSGITRDFSRSEAKGTWPNNLLVSVNQTQLFIDNPHTIIKYI